ncbi:MAG: hypothetical protein NZ958_06340 [Bacteroidia bacterium]|nr:hypothetical protein [Bacteroidia bacterium]MDW8088763.1 hypothetical protein [Bacteroidia bacterium]
MSDRIGKIWVLSLVALILGLSLSLWWHGRTASAEAQLTYLIAHAQQQLGCRPYLLNSDLKMDINKNGIPEYLFSCDSALSAIHQRFIWMELQRKRLRILAHHTPEGWRVGQGPTRAEGFYWLIDRQHSRFLLLPIFSYELSLVSEPLQPIWSPEAQAIQFVAP